MTEKQFLKDIGVSFTSGEYSTDGSYVVDIYDSNDFGKVYSTLEASDLELLDDSTLLTVHNGSIVYSSDDYLVTLVADWDNDSYKVVVRER